MVSKLTYLIIGIVIGLVVIFAASKYFGGESTQNMEDSEEQSTDAENHMEENDAMEESQITQMQETDLEPNVIFTLGGENFKFTMDGVDNPDLVVNEGDVVKIEFTSTSGFHDWVVDEFNAATEKVRDGNSTSVTFIADKTGTFEYYCSVGQHRANGMKGNLIVE